MDRFSLDGQVAVVTGGGRGIGRGIALALAEAGADVVVAARRTHEVEAVASEIRALGRRAVAITADVRTAAGNEAIVAAATTQLGRLDVFVANAGGADDRVMRQLADTPESAWDDQIGLNLTGVWLGARAAIPALADGGSIIAITSMAAGRPSANNGPYAAAKAGAIQVVRTLAAELAPKGYRVNAVSPGPIPTEVFMEALNLKEEHLPGVATIVPLGRLGTPEDVGAAVVYLASPAASWITGETLVVNGGMA